MSHSYWCYNLSISCWWTLGLYPVFLVLQTWLRIFLCVPLGNMCKKFWRVYIQFSHRVRNFAHPQLYNASFFPKCLLLLFSHQVMFNSVNPWTVAHQALLSMVFPRQDYWSGFPFPSPEYLPDPHLLHWQEDFFLPLSYQRSLYQSIFPPPRFVERFTFPWTLKIVRFFKICQSVGTKKASHWRFYLHFIILMMLSLCYC